MPCYDPRSSEDCTEIRELLNSRTRLLCAICSAMEAERPLEEPALTELAQWWHDHKAWDAERERINQKKESGERLTSEELSIWLKGSNPT